MGCCASNNVTITPSALKKGTGSWSNAIVNASDFVVLNNEHIATNYKFGKSLGSGSFGH